MNHAVAERSAREAGILLGLALLLAAGAWAFRAPRLPLRADPELYRLDLGFPVLAPARAVALYAAGDYLFIDTRPVDAETAPHIPGALPVREATFADDLLAVHDFVTPGDRLILYGDGNLVIISAVAARFRERGYADVSLLQGDLAAWRRVGGPVSPAPPGERP